MAKIEELQEHLKNNRRIKKVYFNEKGEWLFHNRAEFPIEKTADEVMKEGFELKEKEVEAATKLTDEVKTKTTIEQQQDQEAASDVIPVKEKLVEPILSADQIELPTTEAGKPEGNQVITAQPVIPADVIVNTKKE